MSIDTEASVAVANNETNFEFQFSKDIAELSRALCKAQGAMQGAVKDSDNPFFKSKYADLSAVWEDIREPFAENGLSVIQMPTDGVGSVTLITQITHTSGQWIRSKLTMIPMKQDPQSIGGCITYARRYALAAMAGVYQIDDDGNTASIPSESNLIDDSVQVDVKKVQLLAQDANDIVDLDDEESGPTNARKLYEPLTSDERILLQSIMKTTIPEGCRKTYWAIFHDHLKKAAGSQ
jgi:hypothetical protein